MTSITIRSIDESLKRKLRIQSALHSRSMEEEARDILRSALSGEDTENGRSFIDSIRARAFLVGGLDIDLPPREEIRNPPEV